MSSALQIEALNHLLRKILEGPSSLAETLRLAGFNPGSTTDLETFLTRCPFTTKADLVADRETHPPFGSHLTEPLENYTRLCQTSGTTGGTAMPILDTPGSWQAMLCTWRKVLHSAGLEPGTDRLFFAFSFGPFLGFWTAFEAGQNDYLCLPGGGLSSAGRLDMIERYSATVLLCTPTYAIRLGETLTESPHSNGPTTIRKVLVAGEPGGSLPAVRERISTLWQGAEVHDHHGLTETGPVSYQQQPGELLVDEEAFLAEILDPETDRQVAVGEQGELVLTTLTRTAAPLLRYRTGDLVEKGRHTDGTLSLPGGILGRCDDMVVIRGVNVYPSAIEEVLRRFPPLIEFEVLETTEQAMTEISVRVELAGAEHDEVTEAMASALRERFALRIPVEIAPADSLPRHEFKAKRWRKV